MLFPTISFSVFFLIFITFWYALQPKKDNESNNEPSNHKYKYFLLSIANIIFYAFFNINLVLYLLLWSLLVYFFGREKFVCSNNKYKYLLLGVAIAVIQLIFWKSYEIIPQDWINNTLHQSSETSKWVIPLGISFFTFQGLTYLFQRFNIHTSEKPIPQINEWEFIKVFAFCSFFLTVSSGPITRAQHFEAQIEQNNLKAVKFPKAMTFIVMGTLYKLVLSSYLNNYVNEIFASPQDQASLSLYLGMLAYTFQIFTDFAGYSYMAQGIGYLMGVELPTNFAQPYLSTNVQLFWRRWHMSFSNWLKDYLYIGLFKGNQVSFARKNLNNFYVMIICGAWHGFALHYIVWGLWHAIGLIFLSIKQKFFPSKVEKQSSSLFVVKCKNIINILITFHFAALGWILFRAPNMQDAKDYFIHLFGAWSWDNSYILPIGLIAICWIVHNIEKYCFKGLEKLGVYNELVSAFIYALLIILALLLSPPGLPPFIYYQY
jgi:alginate O-acetyltransferase complex protein AlgI